ncbi:hypothetical protein [Mammaliicoccus vitulinus]|uniref:hypothetical protein n=1 Tax=Mammaliicoccus vitulinus TaxID=71237 RepID=UPI000D1DE7DB|nr:hypothetical protein [Mammaliicoccus vitulinus]PTI71959.1 hypothetical protein BU073_04880 [Mammaliicoccus vitulinus]
MKKLLGILVIMLLVVGGCGNSPQQKAKELEKELDAEFKEKGIDTDYSLYYDDLESLMNAAKDNISCIDDAEEQMDPEYIDMEDQESVEWNLSLASSYITDSDLSSDIENFESEKEYSPTPKYFEKTEKEILDRINEYNSALMAYGANMETDTHTDEQLAKVHELHDSLSDFDDELEELRSKAYDN